SAVSMNTTAEIPLEVRSDSRRSWTWRSSLYVFATLLLALLPFAPPERPPADGTTSGADQWVEFIRDTTLSPPKRYGSLVFRLGKRLDAWTIDAKTDCILTLSGGVAEYRHRGTGQIVRASRLPILDLPWENAVLAHDGTRAAFLSSK